MMSTAEIQVGPKLDALVAEKVMGWHRLTYAEAYIGYGQRTPNAFLHPAQTNGDVRHMGKVWRPSMDIAAAWQVVEHMATTGFKWWEMARRPYSDGLGALVNFSGDPRHGVMAPTVCEAICLAALKAVEE